MRMRSPHRRPGIQNIDRRVLIRTMPVTMAGNKTAHNADVA